jgi:hypothetical protein
MPMDRTVLDAGSIAIMSIATMAVPSSHRG